MTFISIKDAMAKGKGQVAIRGWVYRERGSNKFKFIVVRDGSDIIQCVIGSDHVDWNEAEKAMMESSVEVWGDIHEDKRAPTGFEIHITKFHLVHQAEPFPITKDQSPEFLLDMRHLWVRSRKITAVMKVRSTVMEAFREFYRQQKFVELSPPILQPNQCEGGSTLFEVKYYNDKTFLSQSWQLYAEAAIFGVEKAFCISPCFRAERSKTSRHLSEFWMAEVEAAWWQFPDLQKSAEECVAFIVKEVVEKNAQDLELLGQDVEKLKKIKAPFHKITYAEALKILHDKEGLTIEFGKDLRTVEEDLLMKHFDKPIIVTNYPKAIMAFYKPEDPENPGTALCMDMLAPEGYGEIVGGSQRDTDIERLKGALKSQGEKPENYDWYLDLRKYGSVPHAGYGMGVERVVAWLCKLDNIKDATLFPRTMLRWKP